MTSAELTVGSQMLAILRGYGVTAICSSPGSEWPPLWDAVVEAYETRTGPVFYNSRHEELAASMAMGYYRQTGSLPVLVLHTTVGLLKSSMILRAALHERVPMVVLTGESNAFGEHPTIDPGAHWQGMLGDLGGPAALGVPFTKRTQQVTSAEVLPGMLQDACRAALSTPCGPVVLSIPMEILLTPPRPFVGPAAPPVWRTPPDSGDLDRAADILLQAERPLILTEAAGRRPANAATLAEVAERLAIPVVESRSPAFVNFPRTHPLHQGYQPGPFLAEADVVLLVACAAPWYPSSARPKAARQVILMDEYPIYDRSPYWGFGVDHCVGGDLQEALAGLSQRLQERVTGRPDLAEAIEARRARLAENHRRQRAAWEAEVAAAASAWPVDSRWLADQLGAVLPSDGILVEETTIDRPNMLQYSRRNEPGTYQSRMAGGLGIALGTALGLKVAAPERIVAAVMGDGAFHYNPAPAAMGFAQEYGMPILAVVSNNHAYVSMRQAHIKYYPEGWAVRTGRFPGTPIEPSPDYAVLAGAYGGWGRRVEGPADLRPTLEEALERVSGGQFALVDVPTGAGRRG